jgi:hypothetical protein
MGITRAQQFWLSIVAAIVGLGLAGLLHADAIASVGLVAGVGVLIGLSWAAWRRVARSN